MRISLSILQIKYFALSNEPNSNKKYAFLKRAYSYYFPN